MERSDTTRRPRRLTHRIVCTSVIVGWLTAGACTDRELRDVACLCQCLGAIARSPYDEWREERRDLATCGECGSGRVCNRLYSPVRCESAPGGLGVLCGRKGRSEYGCASPLECAAGLGRSGNTCRRFPAEGENCVADDFSFSRPRCERGLTCLADGRCHRVCGPCPERAVCNLLENPPRCTDGTTGTRCGPAPAVPRFGDQKVECAFHFTCVARSGVARCEPEGTGPYCPPTRCPADFLCTRRSICVPHPCPRCAQGSECNFRETPPRCTSGTVGTRCGRIDPDALGRAFETVGCATGLVCVRRGNDRRCEPSGGDASCGAGRCPPGYWCDHLDTSCYQVVPEPRTPPSAPRRSRRW